jgi:hypothetical protein
MKLLTVITLFVLSLAQPVEAQTFTPDYKVGKAAAARKDYPTALRHLRPLAEQGNIAAQTYLGSLYAFPEAWPDHRRGVAKDAKQALNLYQKASKQGDAKALYNLGWIYENGYGVARDAKQSLNWYRKAAKQGDARAQQLLGQRLRGGNHVDKNYEEAVRWFRKAAKQGYSRAQADLALAYLRGEGVNQDYTEAVRLARKAAEKGDRSGQVILGSIYDKGRGVAIDTAEAIRWYRKAAKPGDYGTYKRIAILEKRLRAERSRRASNQQKELERLRRENDLLKLRRENALLKRNKKVAPKRASRKRQPTRKSNSTGSGFFVSKLGHVVTNQHVVNNCKSVTVGDNANKQVIATVLESDKRNDLALLRISNMTTASVETKSLVAKLGLAVTPLASQGLFRSDSIELGEDVVVAGFPFGDIFSNTVKITKGIISAKRGIGDNTGQFQIDAAVQHGNSGGPIYDENGNIIGVVVAQLNKLKVAKAIGSLPENVNFGIKASTVRQFLTSSGLPTKWSKRSKRMSTKDIARIAENQTVMVVCHR